MRKYDCIVYTALINSGFTEEETDSMDPKEVLRHFLSWEGIIGYDSAIGGIMDAFAQKALEKKAASETRGSDDDYQAAAKLAAEGQYEKACDRIGDYCDKHNFLNVWRAASHKHVCPYLEAKKTPDWKAMFEAVKNGIDDAEMD